MLHLTVTPQDSSQLTYSLDLFDVIVKPIVAHPRTPDARTTLLAEWHGAIRRGDCARAGALRRMLQYQDEEATWEDAAWQ